ncbi:MAG: HNH endonuclease, partial [Myxococcales bacterium]|nr:HNH endonuclease [Myxococcales bacterium]
HAHHIQPWSEGGPTKLSNLVLTCSTHHRLIHEGRLRIEGLDQSTARFAFFDELGREIPWVPTIQRLIEEDIPVEAAISEPRWDGSRMNLGECISAVLASPAFSPISL